MVVIVLGRGAARLQAGRDFSWRPGPPLAVTHSGPVSALPALGAAAAATLEGLLRPDPARPVEATMATPTGTATVEVHGGPRKPGLVLYQTRPPLTVRDRLMTQVVAMGVGVAPARVLATKAPCQVIDVGRPTLVVPVDAADALSTLKDAEPGPIGAGAEAVAAYTITQRRPYAKVTARVAPASLQHEPFVVAATAVHALNTALLRAEYPITRVVVSPPGLDTRIECRCHLEPAGSGPRWVRLRIGAEVAVE